LRRCCGWRGMGRYGTGSPAAVRGADGAAAKHQLSGAAPHGVRGNTLDTRQLTLMPNESFGEKMSHRHPLRSSSRSVRVSVALFMALAFQSCFAASEAQKSGSMTTRDACSIVELDYSDSAATVGYLQTLYQAERFGELDQAISCLMQSNQRFKSGQLGSSIVYWFFKRQMPARRP
jgi:hypothetical protein